MHDIRFAFRSLVRHPGYLAMVVLTLALGIGANTAVFSVFNAVVLRRLPYPEPMRVVRVRADRPFTLEEVEAFQTDSRRFTALSGYSGAELTLTGEGPPETLPAGVVSSRHFEVLGLPPALGRSFVADDEQPGAEGVVVLSDGLWRRRFGGEPSIVGRRIALRGAGDDGRTVIGIMPPGHRPLDPNWQAWVPRVVDRASNAYRANAMIFVAGRLAAGVSLEGANEEIAARVGRLLEEEPARGLENVRVLSLHADVVGGVGTTLAILIGAAALVLLIACANVAHLLLARAERRVHETAVRISLGAGRARLARQHLLESALLGLLGGVAGLAGAYGTLALLRPLIPASVPRADGIGIDPAVLGFTFAVSLVCSLLFGLVPLARMWRTEPQSSLRAAGSRPAGLGGGLRAGLAVGEIALCLVLAAGAGLMLKSLWRLQQIDVGFEPARLLTVQPLPPDSRYGSQEQRQDFLGRVVERIAALPGVESVAGVYPLPMTWAQMAITYEAEGHEIGPDQRAPYADYNAVTPGYFRTLGIPLVAGREFTPADRAGSEEVAILNRAMADRLWPGESAVGKKLRWVGNPWLTVVGVAEDIRQHGPEQPISSMVYRPYLQDGWLPTLYLAVRTEGEPTAAIPAVRTAVWSIDGEVPISSVESMEDRIRGYQADARFFTLLLVLAGATALGLAVVGVYGVMALAASQRRQEYAIRLALGASRSEILRLALRRGAVLVAAGLGLGAVMAFFLSGLLSSLLYQVRSEDPWVFLATGAVLALAGLIAVYLPARWAATTEPRTVLQGP